jgi:hypothetical protein
MLTFRLSKIGNTLNIGRLGDIDNLLEGVINTPQANVHFTYSFDWLSLKGGTGNRGIGEQGNRGTGESGNGGIGEYHIPPFKDL